MRLAIISDIHGNLTALEAVIADLRKTSPDLVLHGGDLGAGGARPAEVVDCVNALGWKGVLGNTDEMLFRPVALTEFAAKAPHLQKLFEVIAEMAGFTRTALGAERIAQLADLPFTQTEGPASLVHASPGSTWVAPGFRASDEELDSAYGKSGSCTIVYGHIHHPYVRQVGSRTIANSGSVSLSCDGDLRASYLLIDNDVPSIRRVQYDVGAEIRALKASGIPHAEWVCHSLEKAAFVMP